MYLNEFSYYIHTQKNNHLRKKIINIVSNISKHFNDTIHDLKKLDIHIEDYNKIRKYIDTFLESHKNISILTFLFLVI